MHSCEIDDYYIPQIILYDANIYLGAALHSSRVLVKDVSQGKVIYQISMCNFCQQYLNIDLFINSVICQSQGIQLHISFV